MHDGNRKDTLEGGAGNDTFVLLADGAQDIIIVGEGDDIIRGGDANDRIVLRTANIQMPEPSEWETVGTGLGDLASTRAIPLLGGFGGRPHLGGWLQTETETAYVYHYQNADPDVAQEWWRPRFESVTRFRPNEFSSWDEYLIRYENDGLIDYSLPFGFTYTLENGNLKIEGSQYVENELGVREYADFTVVIEDFEQGDFGIRFFQSDSAEIMTTIEVSRGEFETHVGPDLWYFPTDQDGIDYINNNGNYITVPEAIDPTVPTVINNPPRPPRTTTGTPDADELRGSINADLVRALAGDDTVTSGGGNDRVDAGEGDDTVYAGLGADLVIGGAGLDQLFGGEGDDGLAGGEDADTLNGGQGDDRLFGDAGDDILRGDYGVDVIHGGSGNDTINGQYDNDELFGEDGDDWLGGGFGDDVLHGDLGNDRLAGQDGDDALNGNDGDDFLNGADGHDTLFGGAGIDRLLGGKGNDTLDGGEGDDELHGQDWDDIILGGEGNDLLYGGTGNDTLDGGAGDDQLFGCVQNDRFIFSLGGGRDTIHDFQNVDVIAIDWDLATSYSNAMAHASQVGDDIVFTFGEDVLTILNTSLSDISFGDVYIV